MEFQRECIKFCVKNNLKCSDVVTMLSKAYGDECMSKTQIYLWYQRFKDGREEVSDDQRPGRPVSTRTDENIEKVKDLVLSNRRLTIDEMVEDLGISHGTIHSILSEDLGMKRLVAKFVPKLLNCQQKDCRVQLAQECLELANGDPTFLRRVITGDESWVYGYDMETKAQSSQWTARNEPRPKKIKQFRSKVKLLLTVFFDWRGIVHYEFLPYGQTVNKEYYLTVLKNLRDAVRRKRPELWKNNSWILHHDNAPSHSAHLIGEFLSKNQTSVLPQPPYSPDLAPCDFFLFSRIKKHMKGTSFEDTEVLKQKTQDELKAIPSEEFERCFDQWKERWHKCILFKGEYFEGDKVNPDE